jgi:hypothetical protein
MKLSELIKQLEFRLAEYGDKEVAVHRQTGPDSWAHTPVQGTTPPIRIGRKSFVVID